MAGCQPARLPTATLNTQQTGGYAASARDPLPVAHLLCSGQHNVPHSRCATQIIHPDAQSYLCASVFRVYTATARQPPRRVDFLLSAHNPNLPPRGGIEVDTESDEFEFVCGASFDTVRSSHCPGGTRLPNPPGGAWSHRVFASFASPSHRGAHDPATLPSSVASLLTLSCGQDEIYHPHGRPDGCSAGFGAVGPWRGAVMPCSRCRERAPRGSAGSETAHPSMYII